jgi:hypothetical protein
LFAGLRNRSVGTDTSTYVKSFLGTKGFLDYYYDDNPSKIEVGYAILQSIASFLSDNYISLLLTVSIFILYFQISAIKKLSYLPLVSFFVFITFGIYTFSFNGIRQAIAASIFMYAVQYVIEGNFKKYAFWILIGFLFHKTIIITLPLYYIFRKRFTFKLFFLLLLASLISSVFFHQIINFGVIISEKYIVYIETEEVGGKLLTLFYTILSIVFVIFRYNMRIVNIKQYDIYLNMFLVAAMIYLIVYFSEAYVELTRLAFYFLISSVFIWPILFKSVSKKSFPLLLLFFIGIQLIFFYIFLSKMSGLIPYKLNADIF